MSLFCLIWFEFNFRWYLQGPFCLLQLVYWLDKGHLNRSDLVYTDNSRQSIPLDKALAGAKPPEGLVSFCCQ